MRGENENQRFRHTVRASVGGYALACVARVTYSKKLTLIHLYLLSGHMLSPQGSLFYT